jgi:predicted DNA-binding transcriptional regulator AlpA
MHLCIVPGQYRLYGAPNRRGLESIMKPNPCDQFPDYDERVLRMGTLLAAHALPLADVSLLLDVPRSTIDKLIAQGRGPRTFLIGRRLYCRQADVRAWLDQLAAVET